MNPGGVVKSERNGLAAERFEFVTGAYLNSLFHTWDT